MGLFCVWLTTIIQKSLLFPNLQSEHEVPSHRASQPNRIKHKLPDLFGYWSADVAVCASKDKVIFPSFFRDQTQPKRVFFCMYVSRETMTEFPSFYSKHESRKLKLFLTLWDWICVCYFGAKHRLKQFPSDSVRERNMDIKTLSSNFLRIWHSLFPFSLLATAKIAIPY